MTLAPLGTKCTTFPWTPVRNLLRMLVIRRQLLRFTERALFEDERGGIAAQCQPEHPACVGAAIWLSETPALARQAPPLHARRNRCAEGRPSGGPLDLIGSQSGARGAQRRRRHAC